MILRKLLKDQYFWYAATAAIIACLFAYTPQLTAALPPSLRVEPVTAFYVAGYRLFFPIAVLFAAWRFGIRGGIIICVITVPIIITSVFVNSSFPNILIDFGDMALGAILIWMVGRQGEYKRRLEETAAKLKEQSMKLIQEIAERKRVEEQYMLIADHTADVIYKLTIKDEKFNYISPSAERVLGYTQEDGTVLKLIDILTTESYRKQNMELTAAIQKGIKSAIFRVDIKHKDGRIIPFEIHTSMIFDENGQPDEIVGVARDITERRKMEDQIIVQDRLASTGQLTSSMAHELNNPLTSVINFSALLLKRDLPEDIQQDIKTINDEARRIALIIKNLLALSRKQPQENQPVDINDSIRKIIDMRDYEQKVNNIHTTMNLDPALPLVHGNGPLLEQVIFNIVINAEYFMREAHGKGTLNIITQENGGNIRVMFTDDGPGIPGENLKNLFTPFFSTKEEGRGTGLSLSICHGIITEHGGTIYAESGTDTGATFIIELPPGGQGEGEKWYPWSDSN